jgi:preprotein translocase subunit SecA
MIRQLTQKIISLRDRIEGQLIISDLTPFGNDLQRIHKIEKRLRLHTNTQLTQYSSRIMRLINHCDNPDKFMNVFYALVSEAIRRTLFVEPFDEQIIGGIALHKGYLIEMQTGEGKTFTAIFAASFNALRKRGVHIITFNDYLAKRDALWAKSTYTLLGFSCAYIQESMSSQDRKKAYNADITYMTARECGFDFLRDSLCYSVIDQVQRPFLYAVIDEADSILIDESRIPLVIADSGASNAQDIDLFTIADIVKDLKEHDDYNLDPYSRNIYLTENGLIKCETMLHCENIYENGNHHLLSAIQSALHALFLLHKDKDYILKDNQIAIVDEHTGRIAHNRRWPDSLHKAVEVKEGIVSSLYSRILNTITLQHLFRLYPRLCGMTATAQDSWEEFKEFYNLDIVILPNHKPCVRRDFNDCLYVTKEEKYKAVLDDITANQTSGRPVLAGTQTIIESEYIAQKLYERGIPCTILNAKNDSEEASIVANAGMPGIVTISTNMAGRGTDIKLGPDSPDNYQLVKNNGGLHVVGCGRFESRRIDNQLRGRSARQGDPGTSRFFMSFEDDMFRKYRLDELLPSRIKKIATDSRIQNRPVVMNEINRIQRIISGQNLEIKTDLYKYSILLEQQRTILFTKRKEILKTDTSALFFKKQLPDTYRILSSQIHNDELISICRNISLSVLDNSWSDYIMAMLDIKDSIHLQRLGGQNPLFEYRKIAISLFDILLDNIDNSAIDLFTNVSLEEIRNHSFQKSLKIPSATWTYFISDNPFEQYRLIDIGTNAALSYGALLTWPIYMIYAIVKRIQRKRIQY